MVGEDCERMVKQGELALIIGRCIVTLYTYVESIHVESVFV